MPPATPDSSPVRTRTAALLAVALTLGAGSVLLAAPASAAETAPTFRTTVLAGPAGSNPLSVAVADLDDDGVADLVESGFSGFEYRIGAGDGTFAAPVLVPGADGYTIAAGDVNGDGLADVIAPQNNSVAVYLNSGNGTFAQQAPLAGVDDPYAGAVLGDFDGDTSVDLAVTRYEAGTVALFKGDGAGGFTFQKDVPGAQGAWAPDAADIDKDGLDDLVVYGYNGGSTRILLSDGDPFGLQDAGTFPGGGHNGALADLDRDGFLDIAAGDNNSNTLHLAFYQPATGTFRFEASSVGVDGGGLFGVSAADYNGDGTVDLGVADNDTQTFLTNDGSGAMTVSPVSYPLDVQQHYQQETADFDKDGQPDVVVEGYGGGPTVLLNTTVQTAPVVVTEPKDQRVASGDTATFTATSSDPSASVQWQVDRGDGTGFVDLGGATSTSYTTPTVTRAADGFLYQAVFTNGLGSADTRDALLTVTATAPTFSAQPVDQTVSASEPATFTVTVAGDPTPGLQWQVSADAGNSFTDIGGATGTSYTVESTTAADDGNRYRAVAHNSVDTVLSDSALLIVEHAPVLAGPDDVTVTDGQSATFTVTVDAPDATVQWRRSTDGGDTFTDIGGATGTSHTTDPVSAADSGDLYQALVTNSHGTTTSRAATLTVTPVPTAPSAPRDVVASQTGPGQVTITWNEPANGGSSPVTSYDVGYGSGRTGTGDTFPPTARSAVFSGLGDGAYTAGVTALNDAGRSETTSVPFTITTAAPTTTVVVPPVQEPAPPVVVPPTQEPAPPVVVPPTQEPAPPVVVPPTTPAPVDPTLPAPTACPTVPPRVTVSPTPIVAGRSARVTVSSLPANSTVELLAYTRPSTAYRVVRQTEVSGTSATFSVVPPANTRLYARVKGCETRSASVVLGVRTAVSIKAVRNGVRTYTFSGDTLPARAGQLVSLYRVTTDGRSVLSGEDRTDSQGNWTITRTFTGAGRFAFAARTGQDLINAPGTSAVRPTLVS